ncbi:MAG: cytochrome b N-terminal domain-containing protein [Polyangiales bacterium]
MPSLLKRLADALEARTGLAALLARALDVRLPGGPRWRYTLGAAVVAMILIEAVTGVAMMTVYSPGVNTAWGSTWFLDRAVPWGHIVRGVHHVTSHALVASLGLYVGAHALAGAHRRPREALWLLGVGVGGLILAFCITGFPLAWDQRGYWSSRVETGILGSMPVVGRALQRVVLGGDDYGSLTLTRFFTLHVAVLPLALAALLGVRLAVLRHQGYDAPEGAAREDRYFPSQAWRDALVAMLVAVALVGLGRRLGAPLDAPADPTSQYPARPEWYFEPLSQLLHVFQGPRQLIGTVVIPGMLSAWLALLPWIQGRTNSPARKALALLPLALAGLGAVRLSRDLHRAQARRPFVQALRVGERERVRALDLARRGVPPDGPLQMMRHDPNLRPPALYKQYCGGCHAVQGLSAARRAPRLDGFGSRGWARAFTVWPNHPELMGTTDISDMPGQSRRLGDEGVAAVAEWLHSRGLDDAADASVNAALVARGEEIYRQRCTRCHRGEGDTTETPLADRDAPDLDEWGSREWIRAQILRPDWHHLYGARNQMPRFRGRLQQDDLSTLVDFVWALRHRAAPAVRRPPPRPDA